MKHLFSGKVKNAKEDVVGYKCFLGCSGCWGACSGSCFGSCGGSGCAGSCSGSCFGSCSGGSFKIL